MESPNVIVWSSGLLLVLGILWSLTLARASSQIMTHAFFGNERPLPMVEFWRYLFATTLFLVVVALLMIVVSRDDLHKPIYRYPVAVVRLISINFIAGLLVASLSWLSLKIQMRRMAHFHHPNLSTWKGNEFWGPEKRRMTPEERTEFLRKMDLGDFLESLRHTIFCFALLPCFLLWVTLMIQAPMQGLRHVITSFFGPMIPCDIFLALAGFIFGTVAWLCQRLFVWFGWVRTLV